VEFEEVIKIGFPVSWSSAAQPHSTVCPATWRANPPTD